jgi:carboxynorspermidine decarboxylase
MNFHEIPSPCFVLDEKKLRQNLETLTYIRQKTGVHIVIALKGFAFWAFFPMLKDYLDGAAASSYNEARLCVEEMKTLAHTYSVVYYPDDFKKIMRLSSHITFNSLAQFEKYTPSVSRFKKHKISCGLRINLEFSVIKSIRNDPSQQGSRLGVPINDLKMGLPEGIEGFLVHCLADSSAIETIQLLHILEEKCAHFLPYLRWINLGGGHLLTEKNYDLAYLMRHLNAFKNKYPHIQLILEPSTAIGFNTGFLRAKVLDIVDYQGIKTLITDISFNAHLINSVEMPLKPVIKNAIFEGNKNTFNYQIGGISNAQNDCLGTYFFNKKINIGDALIFENAMNYTMVKTHFFNGIKHPSIGIWREKEGFDLIRTFDYKDYKKRLG